MIEFPIGDPGMMRIPEEIVDSVHTKSITNYDF